LSEVDARKIGGQHELHSRLINEMNPNNARRLDSRKFLRGKPVEQKLPQPAAENEKLSP
jgi:hypothetical protein